jgi:hypothetical protein
MFPAFKPLPKVHDYTLLLPRKGRAPYLVGCVAEIAIGLVRCLCTHAQLRAHTPRRPSCVRTAAHLQGCHRRRDLAVNLAQIYSWAGEKDLAIEQIAAVERVPNYLTYGLLQLHPYWDSLRGDPRFEKIVASLAPKKR